MHPAKILFLSTANSCRTQMAEGWCRHLNLHEIEAFSAGTNPLGLNLFAIRVMREAGVDISTQHSKHVDQLRHIDFDFIVSLSDEADTGYATFPERAKFLKASIEDPSKLHSREHDETLSHYRRTRDEVQEFIMSLPEKLKS